MTARCVGRAALKMQGNLFHDVVIHAGREESQAVQFALFAACADHMPSFRLYDGLLVEHGFDAKHAFMLTWRIGQGLLAS